LSQPSAIGIDVGSSSCKAVVVDRDGALLDCHVEPSHPRVEEQASRVLAKLRALAGVEHLPVGSTGYGRKQVTGARPLTEITCHARGAFKLIARAGVLVDMGGQDTKVVRIGPGGDVADFTMNDKCAAGTGRFLEVILDRLQVKFDDVAALVRLAERAVRVSSTCTVFAESEVISLIAQGEPVEGIVRGLHQALATRVAALVGSDMAGDFFMSGGVALNGAMVEAISASLGRPVQVLPTPQLIGAIGAALSVL
jgi:predicted CoA-substrate-specific enzyme activase